MAMCVNACAFVWGGEGLSMNLSWSVCALVLMSVSMGKSEYFCMIACKLWLAR